MYTQDLMNVEYIVYNEIHEKPDHRENLVGINSLQQVVEWNQYVDEENVKCPLIEEYYLH